MPKNARKDFIKKKEVKEDESEEIKEDKKELF